MNGGVVIWHIGRCGSTVLGSSLGQHPAIQWENEIFWPLVLRNRKGEAIPTVDEAIAEVTARRRRRIQAVEVKFLEDQHPAIFGLTLEQMVERFIAHGYSHFVVTKRLNHLRRIVSHCVSQQTRQFHLEADCSAPLHRIELNTQAIPVGERVLPLLEWFTMFNQGYEQLAALLAQYPSCEVIYERDIEDDPLVAYRRVCSFLGVEPQRPSILYTRTNPFRLQEILLNYDEIHDHVAVTEHAWMLNEDEPGREGFHA